MIKSKLRDLQLKKDTRNQGLASEPVKEDPKEDEKMEDLRKTIHQLDNSHKARIEVEEEKKDLSLISFLLPHNETEALPQKERLIEKKAETEQEKQELMKKFKVVKLNFSRQFSNLKYIEDSTEEEELEFGDRIYFMVPPEVIIEPSYVITFELIHLDTKLASTADRVVAWGAFPLLNFDLKINEGKIKLPMIRGRYNKNYDKFKDIEGRIKKNIDEWMCNLYINIKENKIEEVKGHHETLEFEVPKNQRDLVEVDGKEKLIKKKKVVEENKDDLEGQEIVITEVSDSDEQQSQLSDIDEARQMLDQNPDLKVDHQDLEAVGIAPEPQAWEEEDEYDIEGVDDLPMKLEDHDL